MIYKRIVLIFVTFAFALKIFILINEVNNKNDMHPELLKFFGGYYLGLPLKNVQDINPNMKLHGGGSGDNSYVGSSKNNENLVIDIFYVSPLLFIDISFIWGDVDKISASFIDEYRINHIANDIDYWVDHFTNLLDSKPIHYYDLSHGIEFAPFNHRYVWHFDKYNFEILQRTGHWGEENHFLISRFTGEAMK